MMNQANIRVYADLVYFLPRGRGQSPVAYSFHGEPSIKDAVEALGIPHPEVELILVNGMPVDFGYHLQHGDRVSVFPVFRSLDLPPSMSLADPTPDPARFVLDIHLGRLAAYLRLLGFDSLYRNDYQDDQLAAIAAYQSRLLLTRDRGLLKRGEVRRGYCLRSSQPREQVLEVLRRFRLGPEIQPFVRCMRCNGLLDSVRKAEVLDTIPDSIRDEQREFRRCQACGQIYWRGSHYERLATFIEGLRRAPGVGCSPAGG